MKKITNIDEFNEIVNSSNLTVVKFGAEWCGPCKAMNSTIENIENDFKTVNFVEVDVEEGSNDEIVTQFNIRNIPVLVFMKNGSSLSKSVGALAKDVLIEKIKEFE